MPGTRYRKQILNLNALGLAAGFSEFGATNCTPIPPLVWVATHGTPAVVKALLDAGVEVNVRDACGRTALHHASAVDSRSTNKIVRLLIATGADVNATDNEGYTPLMRARGQRNIQALKNQHPKMSVKQETETVLKPLIGQPISDMWRMYFQAFEIGVQKPCKNRKGQDITRADLSLHVACNWDITCNNEPIVGSQDFGPWPERHDEHAKPFYNILGKPELTIKCIRADNSGSLWLQTTCGYTLHIATDPPDTPQDPDNDSEQWRFLPENQDEHHFVITASGIQRY